MVYLYPTKVMVIIRIIKLIRISQKKPVILIIALFVHMSFVSMCMCKCMGMCTSIVGA